MNTLCKLNINGESLWIKGSEGSYIKKFYDITLNNENNIVVLGEYSNNIQFDNKKIDTGYDDGHFIGVFDTNGVALNLKPVIHNVLTNFTDLHSDRNGKLFSSGSFYEDLSLMDTIKNIDFK